MSDDDAESMSAGSTVDPHIQALRDALAAEHAERLAEIQRQVDGAPSGWYRAFHQQRLERLERLERLRATPMPWERRRPSCHVA